MRPPEPRCFDEARPVDDRPPDERHVDPANPDHVRELAERFGRPLEAMADAVAEAVQAVGPNRTAVELWLAAPPA